MSFATEMMDMATEVLGDFDERTGDNRLAILKQGAIVWNPTTGEDEIGASVKYFLTGVERTNLSDLVNGTTIHQGDELITASVKIVDEAGVNVDYVPRVNDKMLIDSVEWSIVAVPHANFTGNDLIVVYKMQVRK